MIGIGMSTPAPRIGKPRLEQWIGVDERAVRPLVRLGGAGIDPESRAPAALAFLEIRRVAAEPSETLLRDKRRG